MRKGRILPAVQAHRHVSGIHESLFYSVKVIEWYLSYLSRIIIGKKCKQSGCVLDSIDAFAIKGLYMKKVERGLKEETSH